MLHHSMRCLAACAASGTALFIGCLTSDDCAGTIGFGMRSNALAGHRAGGRGANRSIACQAHQIRREAFEAGPHSVVLTTLGREIAQEIIPAGAVLPPESDLEARFGVGRGVVREAIKTLSGKGLISVRPRHGTRVLPRRDWSLLDRDVLELAGRPR